MRRPSVRTVLLVMSLFALAFMTFVCIRQAAIIRAQRQVIIVLWTDFKACQSQHVLWAER